MKKQLFMMLRIATVAILFCIVGCRKDLITKPQNPLPARSSTSIPPGYTMTMAGLLPDSNITLIEPGYKLGFINGHAFKVHIATGSRVKDLGAVMRDMPNKNAAPGLVPAHGQALNPSRANAVFGNSGQANNWVTFSQWASANPITSYNTTWTVPAAPTGNTGETFAIWTGLEPASEAYPLVQPLLIWGNSGGTIGGGQYWTIVSYILWQNSSGVTLAAISTVKHNIAVGTVLQAQISCSSQQADGSYNCVSQFVGQTSLTITENAPLNVNGGGTAPAPFIPALKYACEVLEIPGAPYITSVNEYPNQPDVSMNSISIATGATHPTVSWQSSSANNLPNGAALGEHTNVVNSTEVDLYFRPQIQPPIITYPTPDVEVKGLPMSFGPTNTGGPIVSYAITPALPAGLSLDPGNGFITGTPTTTSPSTPYKVTATNTGGSSSFTFNMTINAPQVAINGTATYAWSHSGSGSGTITAAAGTLVGLDVAGFGPGNSVNFSLSGAQLSPPATSSNNVTVSNNDIAYTFVMPVSGSVNWSATYTTPTGGGAGNIAPYVVEPPNANINGHTNYKWTSGGTGSGTITAPAGQLVYITFNAESTALSVNFTLTGATLSGPTGNTISVTDNYVVQSFTMPPSGTVSWTGTFTPGTGQGEIDVN